MVEERTKTLYTLWRNVTVFTACGMDIPFSCGEAADFLMTALWGRHAAQDEIRTLQAQKVEFPATAKSVQGQLSQAMR